MKEEMFVLKLMDKTKEKILEYNMNSLLEEWNKIYHAINSSEFTVAVVGEFSRGKSTLVNKLLGSELLPVGNLPTTAMLTKVVYNEKNVLKYIHADGIVEDLALGNDVWDRLVVNIFGNSPEGVVEVGAPIEWLKENQIEIIDTPGAGDLSDKRAAVVNDAIISCDGAILTVSATTALSMTEKAFIEEHLIVKKIPHIIIVLTRLDQVAEEQRVRVIEYVKEKLSLWNMDIPIFIPQEADDLSIDGYGEISGIDNIKNEMLKWVEDSEHLELKQKQFCAQIRYLLSVVKEMLNKEKQLASLPKAQKEEILKKHEIEVKKRSLLWEDYRLEMLNRSNKCADWINKKIHEKHSGLVERLQYALACNESPQYWWVNELPYLLKQGLGDIAKGMEEQLGEIFSEDINWLNDSMTKEFQTNVSPSDNNVVIRNNFESLDEEVNKNDMKQIRTFMRIGITPVAIIGYTLFGPFGVLISLGGGIISEILIDKNIAKQKETLNVLIEEVVNKNLENIANECEKRVQEIYDGAALEVTRQEKIWFNAEAEQIKKAELDEGNNERKDNEKIQSIEKIIYDINTFMGV